MTKKKENSKEPNIVITESDPLTQQKIQRYSKALKKAFDMTVRFRLFFLFRDCM